MNKIKQFIKKRKRKEISIFFVLPSLILYVVIKIIPMFVGLFYSFTNWNGVSSDYKFIGLSNFSEAFRDKSFLNSMKVTLIYVLIVVIVVNILAVIFAVLLNENTLMTKIIRTIYFLPVVVSMVAVAYVWKSIYSYNGVLDYIMQSIGLGDYTQRWISNPNIAIISLAFTNIWQIIGYHMIIILASLQSIPFSLYEAGAIDGCNSWTKFRYITLPLLKSGITSSVILCTIGALNQFALPKILTEGGPNDATNTISLYIMNQAFDLNLRGYASALAMILFVIVMVITILQNTLINKKEVEY